VPAAAFGRFWSVVRGALADGGRALFVDDQPAAADHETYLAGSGEVVERRLADGTRHRLIKVARAPAELTRLLTGVGWQAAIWTSGPDWRAGQARPVK
jgi:demethylmenaquinone methyltransferase/2-methoxy-6-polyprenyl-1,4-benzoquinol methylase